MLLRQMIFSLKLTTTEALYLNSYQTIFLLVNQQHPKIHRNCTFNTFQCRVVNGKGFSDSLAIASIQM